MFRASVRSGFLHIPYPVTRLVAVAETAEQAIADLQARAAAEGFELGRYYITCLSADAIRSNRLEAARARWSQMLDAHRARPCTKVPGAESDDAWRPVFVERPAPTFAEACGTLGIDPATGRRVDDAGVPISDDAADLA